MIESINAARTILFFGFILFIGVETVTAQSEVRGEKPAQSFIRMDLLPTETSPMKPPLRNIFVPLRSGMTARDYPLPVGDAPPGDPFFPQPGARPADLLETTSLAVSYVGYIDSGQKIVGLILFQGEALTVVEGELLTDTLRVGAVTPENIEIFDRDSKPKIFSLEGETP